MISYDLPCLESYIPNARHCLGLCDYWFTNPGWLSCGCSSDHHRKVPWEDECQNSSGWIQLVFHFKKDNRKKDDSSTSLSQKWSLELLDYFSPKVVQPILGWCFMVSVFSIFSHILNIILLRDAGMVKHQPSPPSTWFCRSRGLSDSGVAALKAKAMAALETYEGEACLCQVLEMVGKWIPISRVPVQCSHLIQNMWW